MESGCRSSAGQVRQSPPRSRWTLAGQRSPGRGQLSQPLPLGGRQRLDLRDRLDVQVERVAEHSARWVIGAVNRRRRVVQGAQQHELRPVRSADELGKVTEVADPPAAPRAQPVELCRPAARATPMGEPVGQVAAVRGDHQPPLATRMDQPVPAEREVTGQSHGRRPLLPGFQDDQRSRGWRPGDVAAVPDDGHRRSGRSRRSRRGRSSRRGGRIDAHGRQHGLEGLGGDLVRATVRQAEATRDPVGCRQSPQLLQPHGGTLPARVDCARRLGRAVEGTRLESV